MTPLVPVACMPGVEKNHTGRSLLRPCIDSGDRFEVRFPREIEGGYKEVGVAAIFFIVCVSVCGQPVQLRGSHAVQSNHHKCEMFSPCSLVVSAPNVLHVLVKGFMGISTLGTLIPVRFKPMFPPFGLSLTCWIHCVLCVYRMAHDLYGQVKQNEAHRMLFQCESGRHKDHVRIRSRATNTFLFFLGIKQPLTW